MCWPWMARAHAMLGCGEIDRVIADPDQVVDAAVAGHEWWSQQCCECVSWYPSEW